jgi:hypothetical protein
MPSDLDLWVFVEGLFRPVSVAAFRACCQLLILRHCREHVVDVPSGSDRRRLAVLKHRKDVILEMTVHLGGLQQFGVCAERRLAGGRVDPHSTGDVGPVYVQPLFGIDPAGESLAAFPPTGTCPHSFEIFARIALSQFTTLCRAKVQVKSSKIDRCPEKEPQLTFVHD